MRPETKFKFGDTVECQGLHDTYSEHIGEQPCNCVHPNRPFRFRVVDLDAYGAPIDERGFVHYPPQCKVINGPHRTQAGLLAPLRDSRTHRRRA